MPIENLISTPEAQADFYPTPEELGKKMLRGIDLESISTVLEPSAGKGDLIRCLAEKALAHLYTLSIDAIEIDPYIRSILNYEFGGTRQQEIQQTLREFEDRTRYDYMVQRFFLFSSSISYIFLISNLFRSYCQTKRLPLHATAFS